MGKKNRKIHMEWKADKVKRRGSWGAVKPYTKIYIPKTIYRRTDQKKAMKKDYA